MDEAVAGVLLTGPNAALSQRRGFGQVAIPLFAHGVPSTAWRDDGLMITVPTGLTITPPAGVIGWVAASSGAIYRFRGARIMNSVVEPGEKRLIVVRFAARAQHVGDLILTEVAQMIEEETPVAQVFFLPVFTPYLLVGQDTEDPVTLGQPAID